MKITLYLALFASLTASLVGAVCPDIQLEIEGDTCETPEEFTEAFEPIYKAIFNWVDWNEYYGLPPRPNLNQLSSTSYATIESETILDETSAVVTSNQGGYSIKKGSRNNGRFLEAMEGPERELFECYPPLLCKAMGWCCAFCPCNKRRLGVQHAANPVIAKEAAKMEEDMIAEAERNLLPKQQVAKQAAPQAYQEYANVCEWLKDQRYQGCLKSATMLCTYHGDGV